MSKLDQGDRNIRLDRAEFIDLRSLTQDTEFNPMAGISGDCFSLLLVWPLEMWKSDGPHEVEMPRLPGQSVEEAMKKLSDVSTKARQKILFHGNTQRTFY